MQAEISNLFTLTFIHVWRQIHCKKMKFPIKDFFSKCDQYILYLYIYMYPYIYLYMCIYICIYTEYTTLKKPSSGETRQNTSVVQSFLLTNFPSPSFTYIYISERYVYISGLPTLMWLSTLIWLHPWIRYTHVITYSKFLLK